LKHVAVFLLTLLLLACARTTPAPATGPGFRSPELLQEHYQKHGSEFGAISKSEYLRMAQQLRDTPAGNGILEHDRRDGVITKFDRRHGWFGAYDADGIIRTFFVPNDGERYFDRQARSYDRR
jgi:pyocin large subunit-like protein